MWGGVHVGEGPGGHLPARHRLRAGPDCVALEQNPLALREDYCGRSSFTEAIAQLPARARTTRRLRTAIGAGIGDATRLVAEVTQAHGVSWPTAHRAFVATPKRCWSSRKPTPVLGIDETRRGRPRWQRYAATGRRVRIDPWDTGFVDTAGDEGLLGQREGFRAGRYSIEELSSELGEVISGQNAGRTSDNDITIAKFVGIARKTFVAAGVTLARLTGLRPPAGQRDLAGGR